MEFKQFALGFLTAAVVFGAYFLGLFQGQRQVGKWREFFSGIAKPLTRQGFLWSLMLPTGWVVLYYGFVANVWLSLGRWPRFNEQLDQWSLSLHHKTVELLMTGLMCSLFVVPIILIGCLFFPRWRHISVYALCYGGGVGLAFGSLFLAPHPFLNWLLD